MDYLILICHLYILILIHVITAWQENEDTEETFKQTCCAYGKWRTGDDTRWEGWITKPESNSSWPGDPREGNEGGRKVQGRDRGSTSQASGKEGGGWHWGTFEDTGAIFNTGIDHREVLKQGFLGLCYSLLVVSSATGAEVEKSISLFNNSLVFFWTVGFNLIFSVNPFISVLDFYEIALN